MNKETVIRTVENFFSQYGERILFALALLAVGYGLISVLMKFIDKLMRRSHLEPSIKTFFHSALKAAMYVLLIITCLVTAGLDMTSVIAMVSVLGLAVSLAVQDTLGNLAGGILILITKPFSVGDFVEVDSLSGTVKAISLFYTTLDTIDNKRIYLTNGDVAKARLVNYNGNELRRLDLVFSVAYEDDFRTAKRIIAEAVAQNPKARPEPEPVIRVCEHGESAIKITCYVWVEAADLFLLKYDLLEEVKLRFDEAGIHIPYPQMDLHLAR